MKKNSLMFALLLTGIVYADGELDVEFNAASDNPGRIFDDFFPAAGGSDNIEKIEIQSDGKIVVCGFAIDGTPRTLFAVSRYYIDGTIDTFFNSAGTVTGVPGKAAFDFGATGTQNFSIGMAIQSDGKILVAGKGDLDNTAANRGFGIVRLNTDGTLDTTFNGTGKVLLQLDVADEDRATAVVVQPDGKIVVAGDVGVFATTDIGIVRLNSDGSLDTTFNSTGIVINDTLGNNEVVDDMVLQSDGKILVSGQTGVGGTPTFAYVARFNSNGTLDTTFNSGGADPGFVLSQYGVGAGVNEAKSLVIQRDEKIIMVGIANSTLFGIARFNADGTLDTTFGTTGELSGQAVGGTATLTGFQSVVLQVDNKILVCGQTTVGGNAQALYKRFNTDGSNDTTFNNANGEVVSDFDGTAATDRSFDIALQVDGKILMGGDTNSPNDFAIERRLNASQSINKVASDPARLLSTKYKYTVLV